MAVAKQSQASSPVYSMGITDGFDSSDDFFLTLVPYVFIGIETGEEDFQQQPFQLGVDAPISISDELDVFTVLLHFYLVDIQIFYEVDIDVSQNFTEQLLTEKSAVVDSSDAVARIDNLDHNLAVATTSPTYFKEFHYDADEITGFSIYEDSSKSVELYEVLFVFSSGALISKSIVRKSDNRTLTIQFNYTDDILISQTRSIS